MHQDGSIIEKPFERKALKFRFPELERSGKRVLEVRNLNFEYDGKVHENVKLSLRASRMSGL